MKNKLSKPNMYEVSILLLIVVFLCCSLLLIVNLKQEKNIEIVEAVSNEAIEIESLEVEVVSEVVEEVEMYEENNEEEDDGEEFVEILELTSLGEFKLTAYCPCRKCCGKWANNRPVDENGNKIIYGSIGERLTAGYSIAVDPKVIPYGTEVVINGHTYKAQDCGGAIKGKDIDIYFEDHNEALKFEVQYAEVFKIEQ